MKKSKAKDFMADMPRTPPGSMAPAQPMPTEEDKMRSGEMDLDHLLRAEDIKQNPDKMKYVAKAHEKRTTSMRSLGDLKMAAQALAHKKKMEMQGQNDGDPEDAKDNGADEATEGKKAQPRVKQKYPKGA